ncbi:hypothetical protein RSOLAG22IIIB_09251 [Rhizoctonia solani]|uniref:N-acetyltransferase domain-containing protein n=1 Tax=Rhizoctonia solani TaxID=456999 RepID=A0A0K6FXW4_9AGAM|nr:hypothetical protein RSOLAG22IIIB_09251 [Rhizoctonia solani]
MSNATPDIIIRPFDSKKDTKEVQMLVGMSAMEQLAIANRKSYLHPLLISVWVVFASIIIQVLHLWPTDSGAGWLNYLAPVPPVAGAAVPFLFAMDWLHRPHFEEMLKLRIKAFTKTALLSGSQPDAVKPKITVMEYKQTSIGCAVLLPCAVENTRPCYRLAHFHVDSPYRRAGVGHDLLSHVAQDLGTSNTDIIAVTSPLTPFIAECLRGVGFKSDQEAIQIWDAEMARGDVGEQEGKDVEKESVFLVDTQRTGWRLSRS